MRSFKQQVALVAFPFASHPSCLLTLGRNLATVAEDVRFSFFTTAASMASMSAQIAACKDMANLTFHAVADGMPEGFASSPQRPDEPIELFMRSALEGLRLALAAVPPVTCLLSDSFLPFTQDLADELGVPRISFWTAAASSLTTHLYTHLIRDTTNATVAVDCIPGLPFLTLQDLPEGVISGRLDSPFSLLLEELARTTPRSAAVIVNTFDAFESFSLPAIQNKIPACLFVGPLHLSTASADRNGCLPFLDSHPHNSVVYVSFGTMADLLLSKHELVALAEGLESSRQPFLWSLKPERQADLPADFVDRVKGRGLLVPWAPQLLVIRHASTGVFLSHGGYNSLLENLVDGVPMIIRPFYGDQRVNSRLVERVLGTGLRLKGGTCTRESVVEAVRLVLDEEEGKGMREKASQWKHKAHEAAGPGGSSTRNLKALVEMLSCGPNSPFSLLLEDVARTAPCSSAIIVNTFDAFESFSLPAIRNKVPACLFVGPLYRQTESADDHHGCLPFLNSHQPNSVIYVCFGTVVDLLLPKHELVGLAEGLESSGQPFLWSLKPERQADLPAGFVDRMKGRGLLVPWAPQPLVIRHASTAVFFFHVGYNSLLENLVDGVPMICRPSWADNHVNSRLVERVLGTGLRLRGGTCTKESVEEAIRLLLHEGEGKAMREKVVHWKSKAQDAMGAGGSSMDNLKTLMQILRGHKDSVM
ncbi:UDP-glycosyltransferase [Nymphaea thermarum]|nr:UDP-glycosyltransferase [Nymphaea thermarum]